jgi:hypothetical protein
MIGPLMAGRPEHSTPRAATLFDALGRDPSVDEAAAALHDALGEAASAAPRAFEPDDVLLGEVDRLAHVYRDDRWTWRR